MTLYMLAPLGIRDATAARAIVGQCKQYSNVHHVTLDMTVTTNHACAVTKIIGPIWIRP